MASLRLVQKIYFILFFISGVLLQVACGPESSQYTNKMAADPFVAPLNSKVTKIVALDLEPGQKIAWMGLNRSGDYNYFQIDQVVVNGRKFVPKSPGSKYVFDSFPPVAAISGVSEDEATKVYVTLTYKAKVAQKVASEPFKAYLLAVIEGGEKEGSLLINLEGYVRGVCTDCTLPLDQSFVYELTDNDGDGDPDLGFFICDDKAIVDIATNNISDADGKFTLPSDVNANDIYRFDFVNLDGSLVDPWKAPQPKEMVFFKSDKKDGFIVIDAGDSNDPIGAPPSIPPFRIPVPSKKLPVKDIDIQMDIATQVACPVKNSDKSSFTCSDESDSGISLKILGEIGLNTSLLTLTTDSVTVDSKGCPGFGTWQGSGNVGDDEMTVIAYATVSEDQPEAVKGQKTNIEGAAVVAVINLKKK